ncbi:hypothetical protein F2Q70_00025005 [Brassica cretica]|uniref:Uncharacterized protein n=1 Tax=Brassica cretica TaxID=69181 RepID=A0A8S9L4L4_BRACR|nr:hypothetical protein F2Q70_00025005 [Brassica cretica]
MANMTASELHISTSISCSPYARLIASYKIVKLDVIAQGVPDPSSDVRDPRVPPARDLFLIRNSIRQLASDNQGVPDQATKDVRDPIEATRSIPARAPFVSSSRLNSFGGPIQQSSKVKR